jgi:hypothetical protein
MTITGQEKSEKEIIEEICIEEEAKIWESE